MFTANANDTRIIPKAIAISKLPIDVSSDIAVVRVLVYPRMLPPTTIARPISEMARPNPRSIAVDTPYRASLTIVYIVCSLLAPRDMAVS